MKRKPMPRTTWTDARLKRLFTRYNAIYWKGRLPAYSFEIRHLEDVFGDINKKSRLIRIDVTAHRNDSGIRATILHEMAHAGASRPGHGSEFWKQIEQLLRLGAPIRVGAPEAPTLRVFADGIPRQFPYGKEIQPNCK